MRFITSIGPNRIERQQLCINSWKQYSDDIVSCNTADDISLLAPQFPGVRFVECPRHLTGKEIYGNPNLVAVYALVQHAPGLLINSDIKTDGLNRKSFLETWKPQGRSLKAGIRIDFKIAGGKKVLNPYGIDAFLVTDVMMDLFPHLGFVLGMPVWDYWMVWHFAVEGFRVLPISGHLLHLSHDQRYFSEETRHIGDTIMNQHYGISGMPLGKAVAALTQRVTLTGRTNRQTWLNNRMALLSKLKYPKEF